MSRVLQFFASLIVLCCLGGSVLPQSTPPTADEKREADKAWEFLIKAKGGREKLHSITNMLYSRSDYGNWTRLYVFPNSIWEYGVGLAPMSDDRSLTIFDGATSTLYFLDVFGITAQYKRNSWNENGEAWLLLETKWFKPEILRVVHEKDGKRQLSVIQTIIGEGRADFVFEPSQLLVSEIRWLNDNGSVFQKDRFFEYTDVDGIKMPQKISTGFFDISNFKGLKYSVETKFIFNVKYLPDLFSNPQPAYSSDAWRRRSIPSVRLP